MKLITIHIILIALITFFGCKSDKENTVKPNLNYNYAGLQTGNYIIYNVDSIFYDDFTATSDTFHFQIKEHLNATFTDLQGDPAYRIERFKKYPDSTHWELVDVWQSKITTTNYQKVEENDRFIKLIFPVRANKTWNGNNFNNLGEQIYEYTAVHQAENIGGIPFDSVATVTQINDVNLITENLFIEKFATNIGMVYQKRLSRTRKNLSAPWLGYDFTMTIVAYGNE